MKEEYREKIEKFLEERKKLQESFVGYIPEQRVNYWILAVKEFLPEILALATLIKKGLSKSNWRITVEVRLILISFKATFRLTTTQLETVLLNEKNSWLFRFLKILSEHVYISHAEWSNRSKIFEPYASIIETLAWKIKDRYHELFLEAYITAFKDSCKQSGHQEVLNTVEMLEGINFTKYFPEKLFRWDKGYPLDLMYKVFIFMKLRMIPSVPYLDMILNEKFTIENELIPIIGHSLGFYTRIPALDKLYRAHRTLDHETLEVILEKNANFLIQEGIANPEIVIGDSTVCRTRKDDPDGTKYHARDAETTRTLKFQAIVDPNCIPLGLVPRKGNENDRRGFKELEQKLRKIKSMAEPHGLQIKAVILDAGYFSSQIVEFIEEEIKAIPIIDINPMNSKTLKLIKNRLEYFKQYFRGILKLGAKLPKFARLCYYRFWDEIDEAETELTQIKGIRPGLVLNCLRIFRELGFEKFIKLYRQRSIVEGLFGMMKSCYALLGRVDRRLPLKGKVQAHKHGLFILHAMQYLAYFNYKILKEKSHLLRAFYYIKVKDISVIY
ncbi:MAG: transposase [Candidatus Helarchaeota archaeon]